MVRSRASYLLLRLVKDVASQEAMLRPLIENFVAAVQVTTEFSVAPVLRVRSPACLLACLFSFGNPFTV